MGTPGSLTARLGLLLLVSLAAPLASSSELGGRKIGIDLAAGVPQLIGLEASYVGWEVIRVGFGLGTFPAQSLLAPQVRLDPIPMNLSLPGTYNLHPSATFSLSSFSIFARYFPMRSGFFVDASYARLSFGASMVGDLRNETEGTVSPNAISGKGQFSLPMVGIGAGYQFIFLERWFLDAGLGLAAILAPKYSVSMGGTAAAVLPIVPGAEEEFDAAKADMIANLDEAVARFRDTVKAVPTLRIGVGVHF